MTLFLRWSLAALACLQAACAAPVRPDHLAQQDRQSLGRIAVVAARFQPEYSFDAMISGKGEAAAIGALRGAVACAGSTSGGGWVGGLVFLVCAPIAATVGAVSGASGAASAEQVGAAKAQAQRAIDALRLQDIALQAMLDSGRKEGFDLGRLEGMGPANQDDLSTYAQARAGADTVIEVSVLSATAVTTGAEDLRIGLGIRARVRVVSTRDGKEIDTLMIHAGSELRTLDQWLAAEGRPVQAAFERGAAWIAEQALDEILLIYHPGQLAEPQAGGDTGRVPPYALRALEPPIRNKLYWDTKRITWGHLERHLLNSLQPEFRWEAWPRGFDIVPGSGPKQARDVRYDLRVLGADGMAYERRGLVESAHRLEQPLAPCATYRWTVRARFMLNDAPRVTEWTGAYESIGATIAPWWFRRGSGAPALIVIGNQNWYFPIVETPGQGGEACPGR